MRTGGEPFAVQSIMLVTSADCSGPLPRCHLVIGLAEEEEVLPQCYFLRRGVLLWLPEFGDVVIATVDENLVCGQADG